MQLSGSLDQSTYFDVTPIIGRGFIDVVAVVKSPSPFKTAPLSEGVDVILGMVLEYYPNGTLEDAIHRRDGRGTAWKTWPYLLACALLRMHDSSLTHMDITPRNVVIDAPEEAVFIDIGVGYTYENLAPEFRNDSPPLDLPFDQRCQDDWWAFGKLLIELASIEDNGPSGTIIRNIGLLNSTEYLDAYRSRRLQSLAASKGGNMMTIPTQSCDVGVHF